MPFQNAHSSKIGSGHALKYFRGGCPLDPPSARPWPVCVFFASSEIQIEYASDAHSCPLGFATLFANT